MPSGASPATRLPSKATVPSVAGVNPAMISSSVDLPQPDGPTTAKNSPRRSSRSSGPSACSDRVARVGGKVLRTLRSSTCAVTAVPTPRASTQFLQVVRKESGIDDLVVIDFAVDRADRPLRLDHPLEAIEIDRALPPVRNALRLAGREIVHGALRNVDVDVVLLRDDLRRFVRMLAHEDDGLAARADDGANEVALLFGHLDSGHADDVVERRQRVARYDDGPVFVFVFRPQRLGYRHDVDLSRIERRDAFAEAAGLHELGVIGLVAGGLQQHARKRLARRTWIRVADFLALDVLDRFDRRIGLDRPDEFRDGEHVVAHDLQIGAGEDR